MLNKLIAVVVAAASILGGVSAQAQTFPNRTVTIVVPFTAGGSTDAWLHPLTRWLSDYWKQPVILDHKPGAGTTVAAAYVADQKPDGYKLFATGIPAHTISGRLVKSVRYDVINSFTPISGAVDSPYVVLVNPSSSASSMRDLLAYVKANPGKVDFGSSGSGTGSHLTGEVLKQVTGIDAVHVPFRGAAPEITALLGGHVDYVIVDFSALSFIRSGQLRALAITSLQRSPILPSVPTLNETVAHGFDITNRNVLLGPAGMDPKVVASITDAVHQALRSEEIRKSYATLGLVPLMLDSEQLGRALKADYDKFGEIIQRIGLKPE